jgi:YegS/Rv2252/BmrU family lipid kinase
VPTFSHTVVIVNGEAGGGTVRRLWPRLLREIVAASAGRLSVRWTPCPEAATELTRTALHAGGNRIVAVGGDGTLHEVVNGFFDDDRPIAPQAVLVHLPCGTGGDFRRALQVGNGLASAHQLRSPRVREIDLLRVRYASAQNEAASQYVANVASCGLGGRVVQSVEQTPARLGARVGPLGGTLVYLGAILYGLATDRPARLRIEIDGRDLGTVTARNVAIANGPAFGGGLRIAPRATIDDGELDVVIIEDVSLRFLLSHAHRFYRGTHAALPGVHHLRGRRVTLHPAPGETDPVWLEGDGELLGRLPASVEVMPRALRIQS